MRKFKIAYIGQKGVPATYGGVERHVEALGERVAKMGHSVIVYTRKNYNDFKGFFKGMRVINLPAVPEKHTEMFSHTLLSCLDVIEKDIDIVHIHSVDPTILSFIPRIKTKVIATSHGQAYRREKWGRIAKSFSHFAEKLYVTIPDARISVSKTLKKYYESRYGCYVHYIPNGVEFPELVGLPDYRRFKNNTEEVKLEKNSYILYVGRILPTKGVDILINAWKELRLRINLQLNKNLVIAGGSSYTNQYVENLKQQSDESIIWLGYRYGEELNWLYANAYCVVLPSEIEGLALTLLEAMSYGKCVIYSDIPENVEVAEGVGIPFKNKNHNDLAEKIKFGMDNHNYCQELGKKARERIKKEYDWNHIALKTIEVYESLLK